ncbi:MAG: hypothetical protein HZC28_12805 [Spirochaetes bacterium]|nr:hypothetical protein [Spirochaetota bacterium]
MEKQVDLWVGFKKAVLVIVPENSRKLNAAARGNCIRMTDDAPSPFAMDFKKDRRGERRINSTNDEAVAAVREADSMQIFEPGADCVELEQRLEHVGLKKYTLVFESPEPLTHRDLAAKVRDRFLNHPSSVSETQSYRLPITKRSR